jgi:hypothetical protein
MMRTILLKLQQARPPVPVHMDVASFFSDGDEDGWVFVFGIDNDEFKLIQHDHELDKKGFVAFCRDAIV